MTNCAMYVLPYVRAKTSPGIHNSAHDPDVKINSSQLFYNILNNYRLYIPLSLALKGEILLNKLKKIPNKQFIILLVN